MSAAVSISTETNYRNVMIGEVPPGEISLHKCSQCNKSFKRERALRKHTNLKHTNAGSKTETGKDFEGQGTSEKNIK